MSPLRQLLLLAISTYFLGSIPFGLLVGLAKGVATSAGLILGLWPYYTLPALIAFAVFLIAFFTWRYVSLASMLAAISFPIAYLIAALVFHWPISHQQLPLLIFAILVAAMI